MATTTAETISNEPQRMEDMSQQRLYQCSEPNCDKSFSSFYSLKRHMVCHSSVKKFVCSTCGKRFKLMQYLKEHLYTHTGERPFVCGFPGCSKRFRQGGKLSLHRKTHQHFITAENGDSDKDTASTGSSPLLSGGFSDSQEQTVEKLTLSDEEEQVPTSVKRVVHSTQFCSQKELPHFVLNGELPINFRIFMEIAPLMSANQLFYLNKQ